MVENGFEILIFLPGCKFFIKKTRISLPFCFGNLVVDFFPEKLLPLALAVSIGPAEKLYGSWNCVQALFVETHWKPSVMWASVLLTDNRELIDENHHLSSLLVHLLLCLLAVYGKGCNLCMKYFPEQWFVTHFEWLILHGGADKFSKVKPVFSTFWQWCTSKNGQSVGNHRIFCNQIIETNASTNQVCAELSYFVNVLVSRVYHQTEQDNFQLSSCLFHKSSFVCLFVQEV